MPSVYRSSPNSVWVEYGFLVSNSCETHKKERGTPARRLTHGLSRLRGKFGVRPATFDRECRILGQVCASLEEGEVFADSSLGGWSSPFFCDPMTRTRKKRKRA